MTAPRKCSLSTCSKSERNGERNVEWMPKQNETDSAPYHSHR